MTEPYPSSLCEDEIELIDILRILFKWKWFITAGVCVFGLTAVLICLNMNKVYRVSMTIQPGIMPSVEEGKRVPIDAVESIAARIMAGVYDKTVIDETMKLPEQEKPQSLDLAAEIPKQSDLLVITYDTDKPELGVLMLRVLFDSLSRRENELIRQSVDNLNRKITLDTMELEKKKEIEQSYATNIVNIEKRIKDLTADIEANHQNGAHLTAERESLLATNSGGEKALAVLLYSNTIQQNIQFLNGVKKDLNEHQMLREQMLQSAIVERNDQKKIAEQIAMNTRLRDHIVTMTMLREPMAARNPIKPRTLMVSILAMMAGFFVMIFVSFFVEYIRNNPVSVTAGPTGGEDP